MKSERAGRVIRFPRGESEGGATATAPELEISAAMRLLRAQGLAGPAAMQVLSIGFHEKEHGRSPRRRRRGWSDDERLAILAWTEALFTILACLSSDLAVQDPRGSENAIWFLSQVGLTPRDLGVDFPPRQGDVAQPKVLGHAERWEFVARVWESVPEMAGVARGGCRGPQA